MKYCGYCGAENQDTDVSCGVCGAPFQDMYNTSTKKSGGHGLRIAAIIGGGVAALALVVGVIVAVTGMVVKSNEISLGAAYSKTFALLEEQLEDKSNLNEVFDTLGERVESGEFYCEDARGAASNIMYVLEGLKIASLTRGITEAAVDREILYIMQGLVADE